MVGLGCNNFGRRLDAQRTAAVVGAALEAGIDLFDTAEAYGDGDSERFLGAALGDRRDAVVIATKFGLSDGEHSPGHPDRVRQACDGSLERLGTDRIDLYQMHTPDDEVPIADTLGALGDLVRAGKVLEVGCSNFSAAQIDEALAVADAEGLPRFVSVQNRYSALHREPERDVLPACVRHGLGFLPYFPLESGLLTGKYTRAEGPPEGARLSDVPPDRARRFLSDEKLAATRELEAFASARERTLLELAFSWLLAQPAVTSVIAGATSPEQVRGNAAAAGWSLSAEDLDRVDAIVTAQVG